MSRQDDIKKLITAHNRRLQILNEQRTLQGISVEPKVIITETLLNNLSSG